MAKFIFLAPPVDAIQFIEFSPTGVPLFTEDTDWLPALLDTPIGMRNSLHISSDAEAGSSLVLVDSRRLRQQVRPKGWLIRDEDGDISYYGELAFKKSFTPAVLLPTSETQQ